MARRQTRRTISFNREVFERIKKAAAKQKVSAAEFVAEILREHMKMPKTSHMRFEDVAKAQRGRERQKTPIVPPSAVQFAALREQVIATMPSRDRSPRETLAEEQARQRRISSKFVVQLRRRGWLTPDREGYASVDSRSAQ